MRLETHAHDETSPALPVWDALGARVLRMAMVATAVRLSSGPDSISPSSALDDAAPTVEKGQVAQ